RPSGAPEWRTDRRGRNEGDVYRGKHPEHLRDARVCSAGSWSRRLMIQFFREVWSQEFMQRALVGGALIGFTNGFLGAFIVLRRMSLMADALSHSMLPGLA